MKNLYILIPFILLSFLLQGQSVLHYEFANSLEEKNGNGPDLQVLGDVGVYLLDTLNEVGDAKKWVYRFEENSGCQFDASLSQEFLGENYTIELYFVFDELSSWKRVVDWKNRKSDNGAYVYNGELNFYPYIYSDEAPVVAGEYTYYVITRDMATNELLIYTDAKVEISFVDNSGDALLDADDVLNFFHDDLVVSGEASSGAVAMLKLYDYVLDSATIKKKYDDLAGNIFFIGENSKSNTTIQSYPNPVSENLNVDLSNFDQQESVTLSLVNSIGRTVYQSETDAGRHSNFSLNVSELKPGLYILFAESESKRAHAKVLIQK